MTRSTRWLDADGPDDADLRAALQDARRGPSAAQLADLSTRLVQHFAAQETSPAPALGRTTRPPRRAVMIVVGVGLALLALTWPRSAMQHRSEPKTATQHRSEPKAEHVKHSPVAAPVAAVPAASPLPMRAVAPVGAGSVRQAAPRARPRVTATSTAPHPSAQDDEVSLLQRAQRSLLARPALALALASDHQRLFPAGLFAEEREAIAIEALQRLHRRAEADARQQLFYRRYPHSTYRQRLEQRSLAAP